MKISKSKQELARIISENGGWRDGAESAAQRTGGEISFWIDTATKRPGEDWRGSYLGACADIEFTGVKLPNWHQTILSRDEYFHLHPAPDADGWIEWKGGECPVEVGAIVDVKYANNIINYGVSALTNSTNERHVCGTVGSMAATNWEAGLPISGIIAYRLHKPEQSKPEFCDSVTRSIPEPEGIKELAAIMGCSEDIEAIISVAKSNENWIESLTSRVSSQADSIEQLAADYHAKLAIATQAQEEADSHRCGAEVALSKLEIAVKELGFSIEPITAKQEPELVITDWRGLRVGDEVEVVAPNGGEVTTGERGVIVKSSHNGFWCDFPSQKSYWYYNTNFEHGDVKFIRRP